MDSLELKVPEEELIAHLAKLRHISQMDKPTYRKVKSNKASKEQQTIRASERELKELKSRTKKWSREQDQRVGANNKNAKYTSNKTHYSPTDPDARISVKPGKARKLNYQSQLVVDTSHHVISHIGASYADLKDNQCLQDVVKKLQPRLKEQGLYWENVLADTGYSSGENYAFLEKEKLTGYIPAHGTYKGGPAGFTYDDTTDSWLCGEGKVARYRKLQIERKNFNRKRVYSTHPKDCRNCPIAIKCKGVSNAKRFTITYYKAEYDRMIARLKSRQGRRMKSKRQSTVEPVFGTLTQFMGLRKVNTIGIREANKAMLISAVAYNIKKYLKFTQNRVQSMSRELKETALHFLMQYGFE